MTRIFATSRDLVPPWILFISVFLHGIFILALVIVSHQVVTRKEPPNKKVSTLVNLVSDPSAAPPAMEKLQETPMSEVDTAASEPPTVAEKTSEPTAVAREVVDERKIRGSTETIRVSKRKRQMKQVKAAKPAEKKPEATAQKKEKPEDPDAILQKKLAALREKVEKRKAAAPQAAAAGSANGQPGSSGNSGPNPGTDPTFRELVRWLDGVRSRINSRWSVPTETRPVERVTIVGVRIGDDGRLIGATIHETSGDELFDRSAVSAVFQAAPFPPVPAEVSEKIRKAGGLALRFTPKGMQ
ncbi:MAG: cell envelope integrity protein TolA [Desulfomonile tiedjei]|nr:cell envelope integrity protein TolA [Desulfomonile tiedjei]